MVYALNVDQLQAVELAYIGSGSSVEPGTLVDRYDTWLGSVPEPVDTERAQLLAALGVAP